MLEAKIDLPDDRIPNAKRCILRQDGADNYTLAVSAYAMELLGENVKAAKTLKKLLDTAEHDEDFRYWRQPSGRRYYFRINPNRKNFMNHFIVAMKYLPV